MVPSYQVSKDLTNLFFAGRLASFSHVVYGSQRVMKTCATMGQATGTAAAYATVHGVDPIALKDHPEAVWSIQQQLLRDDAFIIGSYNADPRDHARNATITASSERTNGTAANIVTGQTRAVVSSTADVSIGHGGGVPASQAVNGTNRWISNGLPASISLALQAAVAVKQVQLVFDTGMHRMLSYAPTLPTNNPAEFWGPQKETVRDYYIEGETADGEWKVLCNVSGNYQRRVRHTLPCRPPTPSPVPPPPVKPVVAAGSVSARFCNVTSQEQRWTLTAVGGDGQGDGVIIRSADQKLCVGFDSNTSAYGGLGNSVVARPCGASAPTAWQITEAVGGSFLQTALAHDTCSGEPSKQGACECVHPVACTACHGDDVYKPPTSVELAVCVQGSHMNWTSLQVNDGQMSDGTSSVLLMTGGLCMQAPADQKAVYEAAHKPALPQRVQAKSAEDLAAEIAPVPAVTRIRVTVTATNGIADAHINEVRLYGADGVEPFPKRS
jgi:hypothetical protein